LIRKDNTSREQFYLWLAIFRFLLGVGAGGVYPLAAVLSAEQGQTATQQQHSHHSDSEQQNSKQVRRVVLTFGTQGLGFITAPLVAVALLYTTTNLNLVWRLILALGSVPGIIMMAAHLWLHRSNSHAPVPLTEAETRHRDVETNDSQPEVNNTQSQAAADQAGRGQTPNEEESDEAMIIRMQVMEQQLREDSGRWAAIRKEPYLVQKLLGTAGTWFGFDVLFYGNALFQGVVIEAAFGASDKGGDPIVELRETAIRSLILTSIALPGYAVAGLVMGKRVCCMLQTPKFVMLQGFAAMATLYLAIGLNWSSLRHAPILLLLLYGMTFFFANYGPNTTTFILPSLVFSPECRTTLNGVSAAAGKLGALTGATLFGPAAESFGDANVMLICAGIAVLSFLMTWKFVQMHPTSPHYAM
jgi:MFS transporter, PHS family, inorganic phosphate transporter